jgi:hypothetical protein
MELILQSQHMAEYFQRYQQNRTVVRGFQQHGAWMTTDSLKHLF